MAAPGELSSVGNALRLLRILGEHAELGVADASRALGVARSTAHRLLTTLVAHGFATRDPERRTYSAGPSLAQAGLAVIERHDVRERARPYLETLAERTAETAHVVVLAGTLALFVDGVEGRMPVRTASRVGTSLGAHTTSGGKALLAELSPRVVRALYPGEALALTTGETIRTRTALLGELERVRELGYAFNLGESDPNISAVAVAVHDRDGSADFALGVSAPAFRSGEREMRELAALLLEITG